MPLPRRTFLRTALRSTLSVGLLLTAARVGFGQKSNSADGREIPIEAQKDPVFLFRESTFQPYLGGIFQAPNSRGEMIELRLVRIMKHEQKNELTKRAVPTESFSLMFKAADELPPFTSIHHISHPALGKFDLFLSPRKTDKDERF
ncbi:MAG TPA: hypothetical protein VF435_16385, partial [Pyrinomonadaceae bacterium]